MGLNATLNLLNSPFSSSSNNSVIFTLKKQIPTIPDYLSVLSKNLENLNGSSIINELAPIQSFPNITSLRAKLVNILSNTTQTFYSRANAGLEMQKSVATFAIKAGEKKVTNLTQPFLSSADQAVVSIQTYINLYLGEDSVASLADSIRAKVMPVLLVLSFIIMLSVALFSIFRNAKGLE